MSKTYSEKQSQRAITMASVVLALALIAMLAKRVWGEEDGGWMALGFVVFGFSAVFLLGSWFWRSLDDLQRQGHAFSWYWGSLAGLAATACIIAEAGFARSEFTLGVATLMVMQLGFSMILYAFWWLKGRGFSFRSGE